MLSEHAHGPRIIAVEKRRTATRVSTVERVLPF